MKQFRDTDYWVSEGGEVVRHRPEISWESHHNVNGKIHTYPHVRKEYYKKLKGTTQSSGYSQVMIQMTDRVGTFRIHRMVAELYVPGYFEGAHVDHIDNNKTNNHYTNLQWCTKEYNHHKGDKLTFPLYSEWSK